MKPKRGTPATGPARGKSRAVTRRRSDRPWAEAPIVSTVGRGPTRYAGVMLGVKFSQFRCNSSNCDSVRDRGTECTVHRAENSRRREVAKPGIALGSGPRDRGFESRLPDHSPNPLDVRTHKSNIAARNSRVPGGPVRSTVIGPLSGSTVTAKRRNRQHFRSLSTVRAISASTSPSAANRRL